MAEKGVTTLIETWKRLPNDFKLKIIGGGIMSDQIIEDINANDLKNIEFVGFRKGDELFSYIRNASFVLVPSEWYENNPLSVIEAQCLGTPVLGANIGGIPELIKEGVNGMCFESRNIMDLKNKIEKMFILNVDYKQLAKSSQIRYSSEKHYNELLELYQQ